MLKSPTTQNKKSAAAGSQMAILPTTRWASERLIARNPMMVRAHGASKTRTTRYPLTAIKEALVLVGSPPFELENP